MAAKRTDCPFRRKEAHLRARDRYRTLGLPGSLGSGVRGLGLDDLVREPLGLRAWSPAGGP